MTEKQTVKFGDICREVKLTTKNPLTDGYDKYIGLEHLDSGSLKIKRWGSIAEDNPSFTRVFKKGNILFGKRRPYLKKAAIAEFDGICSGDIIVMEPYGEIMLPELLPFIAQSETFWDWAIKTSSGSLSPRTKYKALADYCFYLPDKNKQHNIISILDKHLECITNAEKALEASVELNRHIEIVLFTKGLNGYKEFNKNKEDKKPSHWKIQKLSNIAKVTDGTHFTPSYIGNGVPFLRVTDIQAPQINLSETKFISKEEHEELCKRCRPEKGDILLSKNGTIGITKLVDWDWEFSIFVSLCLIKIEVNSILPEYLLKTLGSEFVMKQIKARSKKGTITNLHLEEIREFVIPIPPIVEQKEIVKLLTQMEKISFELKKRIENLNYLLRIFFNASGK